MMEFFIPEKLFAAYCHITLLAIFFFKALRKVTTVVLALFMPN